MAINKIQVRNFKSFKDLEINLGQFNVLIGANASGKSNFIQLFQFLKDTIESGLDNAISLQGGIEYLTNINVRASQSFSVKITSDDKYGTIREGKQALLGMETDETSYEFALRFKTKGFGYQIEKDILSLKLRFVELERQKRKIKEKNQLGEGEISFSRTNGKITLHFKKIPQLPIKKEELFPAFLEEKTIPPRSVLLESPFFMLYSYLPLRGILREVSLYDFDPKLPKRTSPITGKIELERDGGNLAIVLKNIIENREKKRKLLNLTKDLLPFIDALGVEKFADKSLLFKLREKFFTTQYLPASCMSDGTINLIALIIALYFEKQSLIIIEEPERNIHPHLISKVVNMMKDASRNKQIIVTTHNPEVVKHAGLENILLVSRAKDGFSTIVRPGDKEEIKAFLMNEIGIEELYVQSLLEI